MEPTIYTNDILITEHLSQAIHVNSVNITRGDVVIAVSPDNPHHHICKRIAAIPGDVIRVGGPGPFGRSEYIPKGHVWLEGDNKFNSYDSRSFGPVPIGLLKGKAVLKIWPLKNFSIL